VENSIKNGIRSIIYSKWDWLMLTLMGCMVALSLYVAVVAHLDTYSTNDKISLLLLLGKLLPAIAVVIASMYFRGGFVRRRLLDKITRRNIKLQEQKTELEKQKAVMEQQKTALEHQKAALENAIKEKENLLLEKNEFMGVVSHELLTPLQTITSCAETLKMPVDPEIRLKTVLRIERAVAKSNLQLNDLLTITRSEAGALEFHPEEFGANGLLEEVAEIEMQTAADKNIVVRVDRYPCELFVVADAGRIAQILCNLFNNAIKYTDSGEVTIGVLGLEGIYLHFRITDTGPGMPSDFSPLEIKPFKRFNPFDKRGGAGLGLKIAHLLTKYMNGSIKYSENAGGGTRIDLLFPVAVRDAELSHSMWQSEMRVLLVDDDEELLTSLKAESEAIGVRADVASSAAMAANMLAATFYTAALIDINMPGRRGDELARDLRRGRIMANPDCELIGMSAHKVLSELGRSPFNRLVGKPFKLRSVLRAR